MTETSEPGRRALWALAALYVVIRAWNLTSFCLDSDEAFSVTPARPRVGLRRVEPDRAGPGYAFASI
ncbi:MAG: hypothetical protein ACM336_11800 [Acidobacteriota bacterium]